MMKRTYPIMLLFLGTLGINTSCDDFLEAKPNKDIVVPSTVQDIRALLDNYRIFNNDPLINFILGDDYETTGPLWEALAPWQQKAYLWESEIFRADERSVDYNYAYRQVFYANIGLDLLEEGIPGDEEQIQELRGTAYFLRAYAYASLARLFLPLPDSPLDDGGYQIPLKTGADITAEPNWSGAGEVYRLIFEDLEKAVAYLPTTVSSPTRPSVYAARSHMARIALVTGDYALAAEQARRVVEASNELMDYNDLDPEADYPFPLFNGETLFYSVTAGSFDVTSSPATLVSEELYAKYEPEDLRKNLFFTDNGEGRQLFRGSYTGGYELFTGIALGEVYLIAAEAYVRLGEVGKGIEYLNALMEKRMAEGAFVPVTETDGEEALDLVLEERSREMVFRGSRWEDIKRTNLDPARARSLEREINGQTFTLSPNDKRQIVRIPEMEVVLEGK